MERVRLRGLAVRVAEVTEGEMLRDPDTDGVAEGVSRSDGEGLRLRLGGLWLRDREGEEGEAEKESEANWEMDRVGEAESVGESEWVSVWLSVCVGADGEAVGRHDSVQEGLGGEGGQEAVKVGVAVVSVGVGVVVRDADAEGTVGVRG